MERWERRNANFERVFNFEMLVHCKVHENERDEKGEDTLIWMTMPTLMEVPGIARDTVDIMFREFDDARTDARCDALAPFPD